MECGDDGMDALPDGVVQTILSRLSSACDVAACAGVSRCWRDCVPFLPALYFPRSAFDARGVACADDAIGRMVQAAARLEELVIYCPFSAAHLPRWLAARSASLRVLELRVDSAAAAGSGSGHLDCVAVVPNLEELRLWGLTMTREPAWGQLQRLRVLEIVDASLADLAVSGAVDACPNLTDLALLGCECSGSVFLATPPAPALPPRLRRLRHLLARARRAPCRVPRGPGFQLYHPARRRPPETPHNFQEHWEGEYRRDRQAPGVGAAVSAWCPVELGSRQPCVTMRRRGEASGDEGGVLW